MEILVTREEMLKAIGRVQGIIEKKSNMPILSTVLLSTSGNGINVAATDLEIGYQELLSANVLKEGSITLPGRKFFEILKETRKEQINIKEIENHRVIVSDGVARFDLGFIPPEDYPQIVEPSGILFAILNGSLLADMIDKTIYAVSMEEAGYRLSGVFMQSLPSDGVSGPVLAAAATDGHRLSLVEIPFADAEKIAPPEGIMVPRKGVAELAKLAGEAEQIMIGVQKKVLQAKTERSSLVMRLLDSRFPDYRGVIPAKADLNTIELRRLSLLEAMKRMAILCDDRHRAVRITLEGETMEVFSTNPDVGEARESMAVRYKGERMEVAFNPRYFIDALQPMASENVSLGFVDSQKPCVISGEADEGFVGLIMPMRL
jgi:DNA polymerase-3 subunit beta